MTEVIVTVVAVVIVTYFSKKQVDTSKTDEMSSGQLITILKMFCCCSGPWNFLVLSQLGFFFQILVFGFCLHFSFWVLSQFDRLSFIIVWICIFCFVKCWAFEFCHTWIFLCFFTIGVFSFVTIWVIWQSYSWNCIFSL